ncbi:MAG: RnfH family protein [Lysobacterales bacterium RIFOXYD1_FULL_69_11]|nr:MAG: RnfH family protein [Xanthomonadales bacterium RIFOXYA1_FULL_69_10]OHE88535.1 MAG: RnfH family protein [Xanthomonadales bacterium RIFOXYD1_FULL_69_11]
MRVAVIRAWPGRFESVEVEVPDGATVSDALKAAAMDDDPACTGVAIYGERADFDTTLRDGDRVEVLRPLQADPKDARRRRAQDRARR